MEPKLNWILIINQFYVIIEPVSNYILIWERIHYPGLMKINHRFKMTFIIYKRILIWGNWASKYLWEPWMLSRAKSLHQLSKLEGWVLTGDQQILPKLNLFFKIQLELIISLIKLISKVSRMVERVLYKINYLPFRLLNNQNINRISQLRDPQQIWTMLVEMEHLNRRTQITKLLLITKQIRVGFSQMINLWK